MFLARCLAALLLGLAMVGPDRAFAADRDGEPVTLIIRFEASDAGLGELERILDNVSDAMASEPGFIVATVFRHADQPNVFILEELWQSRALHHEHFTRINASGDWARIRSLLSREPEMGYYRSRPPRSVSSGAK